MPGTSYPTIGSHGNASFHNGITPFYASDAKHLPAATYAAPNRTYGSAASHDLGYGAAAPHNPAYGSAASHNPAHGSASSHNRPYGSAASHNPAHGSASSHNRAYGSAAAHNPACRSTALPLQAVQTNAPHDRARKGGARAYEDYGSIHSRKPTYASAAPSPFDERCHAPAFSSTYHPDASSSAFPGYKKITQGARSATRSNSRALHHHSIAPSSVARSVDELSVFAPTDESTVSSIRAESSLSEDSRHDSVSTPRDQRGSIADNADGRTKAPAFMRQTQIGEVMSPTHDATETTGQPLIVPHREQALTVKGNFSYVEVIGSMVLFVRCTLSELTVRDGGTCLLDHCTITDAMAAAMDESGADIRGAVNCSSDSTVEVRACTISSANIGIKCTGVVRVLWSHVQSRCGIWVTPGGAALVTKCTFRSTGKDFVSEGDGLYYHPGLGGLETRLMAQDPGGIRTYPPQVDYDADGPCYSSGTVRLVPDDYPTLQQALDASAFGDSVRLLCFCRGPVVVPMGVRLFGGSIESSSSALQPCVLIKPFGLLEQCDVRADVSCSVAVQVMRGGLVSGCYVRNDGDIGVVCERGASVCESVVLGKVGIVMEENSLWCYRNVVRKCSQTGIVATNCLVEENMIIECGNMGIAATASHVFNNSEVKTAKQSAWGVNCAWGMNTLGTEPLLVNCVDSEAQLNEDRKSEVAATAVESGNALMKKYDYAYGVLPLESCVPPPMPEVDTAILHADFDFLHHCLQEPSMPSAVVDDDEGDRRKSQSTGVSQRRITLEYYEQLMEARKEEREEKAKAKKRKAQIKKQRTAYGRFAMSTPAPSQRRDKYPPISEGTDGDLDSLATFDSERQPPFASAKHLSRSRTSDLASSGDRTLSKSVTTGSFVDEVVEQAEKGKEDKASFHLRRLRWALYSQRPLRDPEMFLLPVALQSKQWSNGHKAVEQSFINPPTTCHFVNEPLNTVECAFILLEAIQRGWIDKMLLASALGREQHGRLRVTFTKMWASKFVNKEWPTISRALAERRPRGLVIRELFGIQRASKGKVAATFFIASMRSFFSKTLRMAGVEADSVLRLVEDFGRALAKCPEFTESFEQCILPPAERMMYKEVEDIIFALAYAVIMLNTSVHNKSTKRPMGKQEFASFGEQTHANKEILRHIHKMIKDEEL